jgi:hypothetical protein
VNETAAESESIFAKETDQSVTGLTQGDPKKTLPDSIQLKSWMFLEEQLQTD